MRWILVFAALTGLIAPAVLVRQPEGHCATCSPTGVCRACSNCKYCKHCNAGGKCSVCR
jgi:hypothetical protein